MKRVAAIVAAIAMVAAAVLVRGWLDDGGPGGGGGGNGDGGGAGGGDEVATLVCDPVLADACTAIAEQHDDLEIEIADAAEARLRFEDSGFSTRDDPADGWLVAAPLPAMVDEDRDRAGLGAAFGEQVGPLARSPLVITMWRDRAAALAGSCDPIQWRCIGDAAGQPWVDLGGEVGWGRLKPGFESPNDSTTGLLVLGQASTAYFDDPGFASNDFDGGFRSWLDQLEESVPTFPASVGTPLDQMLTVGPSSYDLVGTVEAEAGPEVAGSRDEDRVILLYPSPMATADVVLAPVRGAAGAERLTEILRDDDTARILAEGGWRVDGQPPVPGVDPAVSLPDGNGLPRPGVLQALTEL